MKKKRLITRDRSNPDRMDDDDDDMQHGRQMTHDYPNQKSPEVDMYPAYSTNQQTNQTPQGALGVSGVITSIQPADIVAPGKYRTESIIYLSCHSIEHQTHKSYSASQPGVRVLSPSMAVHSVVDIGYLRYL